MNKDYLRHHYETLKLPMTATDAEVNQRYRELSKIHHPDNQKTGDAELFKKITTAKNAILNPEPPTNNIPFGGSNVSGSYPFGRRTQQVEVEYDASNVEVSTQISFAESVLGTKKEIKFNRKSKCQACNGQGMKNIHNGCTDCNGSGHTVRHQNGAVMITTCMKCRGKSARQTCTECNTTGVVDSEVLLNVNIPGGVKDKNMLRLANMGNFCGGFGPFDQYTDAFLLLHVTPDPNLSIVDNDVVLKLQISLEEAVKGCKKTVKTIAEDRDIEILPMSRNKDEVIIKNMGVNRQGSQRVILDVQYPPNIIKMINNILDAS